MNGWTWAWVGWLAYFLAVEAAAVIASYRAHRAGRADPRDTLSEHVWFWFGVNSGGTGVMRDSNAWARVRRVVLVGFMAWLTIHFAAGGAYF